LTGFLQFVANADVLVDVPHAFKATEATILNLTGENFDAATSHPSWPDATRTTVAAWGKPAGLLNELWLGFTNSDASAHATTAEPTSTKPSWQSAVH
jgi:hypothetical protein